MTKKKKPATPRMPQLYTLQEVREATGMSHGRISAIANELKLGTRTRNGLRLFTKADVKAIERERRTPGNPGKPG